MTEARARRASAAILLVMSALLLVVACRDRPAHTDADPRTTVALNSAGAGELELLPNIGPTRAATIVVDRDANGLYETLDDLDRVYGVGRKTLDALRPHTTLD